MAREPEADSQETKASGKTFRIYRWRVFALSWMAYAGFYFCRKNFSVAMPLLKQELGFTDNDFSQIIFAYLLSYTVGQFLSGVLSDRFGPRLIVSLGMFVTVVANVLMGFCATPLLFLVLGTVNGGSQSTGWSGTVKNMAPWCSREERGVIMAWWSTCYVLGSFLATRFAAWTISPDAPFLESGWRRAFWLPPVVLTVILLLFALFTRNKPTDAGFSELDEGDSDQAHSNQQNGGLSDILEVLQHSTVWIAGSLYFLLKLTRYAVIFWTPIYLVEHLGMGKSEAGNTSSWYELAGFFGAIFAGYASDKLFSAKRFPIATLMLLGLAVACYFEPTLVAIQGYGPALALGLIGFMTFGPDTLISGAGAVDIGSPQRAATAVGVINGMGSCGTLLSPFLVPYMKNTYGWSSVFYLLAVCAFIAAMLAALRWNFSGTSTEQP